jgi:hypothetical protein
VDSIEEFGNDGSEEVKRDREGVSSPVEERDDFGILENDGGGCVARDEL